MRLGLRCGSCVAALENTMQNAGYFHFYSRVDLRHRLRTVWRDVKGLNPWDTNSKLATYQSFFPVPFDLNVRAPVCLPRHLQLDLSQYVLQNISHLRLRLGGLEADARRLRLGGSEAEARRVHTADTASWIM